jgi:hypothetical protein
LDGPLVALNRIRDCAILRNGPLVAGIEYVIAQQRGKRVHTCWQAEYINSFSLYVGGNVLVHVSLLTRFLSILNHLKRLY